MCFISKRRRAADVVLSRFSVREEIDIHEQVISRGAELAIGVKSRDCPRGQS